MLVTRHLAYMKTEEMVDELMNLLTVEQILKTY